MRPEWTLAVSLTKEREERTWVHHCREAGKIVITASQMGLTRDGRKVTGVISGCSWCGRWPSRGLKDKGE